MAKRKSDRKPVLGAMSESARRAANDLQLQVYFDRYDRFWRLHKLFNYRHFLMNREEMRIVYREAYGAGNFDEDQLIYGHVTNGVLSDAVSELAMLCEDYFGLLRFIREPYFFVKKALAYDAGAVTAKSKITRELSQNDVCRLFFIPSHEIISGAYAVDPVTKDEKVGGFFDKVGNLQAFHRTTVEFFPKHKDFHIQYKHGLKLCLNGLHGTALPEAEMARRKEQLSAPLFAFESKPLFSQGYGNAPFIPAFSDYRIAPHLATLVKELNLLHIEFLYNIDIDDLIRKARQIVILMNVLIQNRRSLIKNTGTRHMTVYVPMPDADTMQCEVHEFDAPEEHHVPQISDFQFCP